MSPNATCEPSLLSVAERVVALAESGDVRSALELLALEGDAPAQAHARDLLVPFGASERG